MDFIKRFWDRSRRHHYESLVSQQGENGHEATTKLDGDDSFQEGAARRHGTKLLGVYTILTIVGLSALITVFAISALFIFAPKHSEKAETIPHVSCGNSSEQAIANGCSFDQLAWAWYPPHCPHYANEEYLKADTWTFFVDLQGKQLATGEVWRKAMDNEIRLWSQRREHLTHCVYMMLSLAQVFRDKTPVATKMTSYKHLRHCADLVLEVLREDEKWDVIDTRTPEVDYNVECF